MLNIKARVARVKNFVLRLRLFSRLLFIENNAKIEETWRLIEKV